jgi:hypothetical protein
VQEFVGLKVLGEETLVKKLWVIVLAFLVIALATLPASAQKCAPTRLLTGKVLDHSDKALPNAVV